MVPIEIPTRFDLARLVGVPVYMLDRYTHNSDRYYKVFYIAKSSGRSRRQISAPSRELKGFQRWIKRYILDHLLVSDHAMGFRHAHSIVDNAVEHTGQDFVLNIDIKDFFPSIEVQRVYGIFKYVGYNPTVSWYLSHLLTYKGKLPQGSPASPVMSNIICRVLDARLSGYCRKWGWSYTRYCDDISISGNGVLGAGLRHVVSIVESEGFKLNTRKTRIVRQGGSQQVTGLVCNEKVRIPRAKRRMIRAAFHQASLNPSGYMHRQSELAGLIAFLSMVDPDDSSIPNYKTVLDKLSIHKPVTSTKSQVS